MAVRSIASRERRRIAVRVAGSDGDHSPWSDPLDIEVGLLDPARLGGAARHGRLRRCGAAATDPVPSHVRRRCRSDEGPALRLGVRRVHRRVQRHRRSATTSSLPAGPSTATASATRRTTSPTCCVQGDNVARCDGRRRLVPRPHRLPRRAPRRLRRRHRPDRPARTALRRRLDRRHGGDRRQLARRPRRPVWRRASTTARCTTPGSPTTAGRRPASTTARGSPADVLAVGTDDAGRPDRPAGAPHRDAPPRRPSTARRAARPSSTSDRTSPAGCASRVRGEAGDEITLRHAEVLEDGELGTRPLRTRCGDRPLHPRRRRRRGVRAGVHDPRLPLRRGRRLAGRARRRRHRGRRLPLRHGADRLVRTARDDRLNRLHENVRWSMRGQLRRRPDRLPAARRTARLDRRHPGVRPDRGVPLRLLRACSRPGWPTSPPSRTSSAPCRPTCPGSSCSFPAHAGGGVGRRRGDRAVGAVRALRRRRRAAPAVRQHARRGSTRSPTLAGDDHVWDEGFQFGDWLDPAAPPDDPGARPHRRRPRRHRLPRPHRPAARRHRRACSARTTDADALRRARRRRSRPPSTREFVTADRPAGQRRARRPTPWRCSSTCCRDAAAAQPGRRPARRAGAPRRPPHRHRVRRARRWSATRSSTPATSTTPTTCCCRRECPSWLYPVTMGATTIWERWDSMLPDGSINPAR